MRKLYLLILVVFTVIQAIACDADISPSDTICFEPGGTYPIIFNGSGGTAPYTFTYSVNGGAPQTIVSSGNSATLDVPMTVIGNTHYTLISVTDASGCTASINESNDILTVINPSYTVSGTTTVYQNSTPFPEFTFTGSGGVTPYTFYYTINGGPLQSITTTPGSSSVSLPVSTAIVGVYTLVLQSIQSPVSCPNLAPSSATNSTATITVIPNPMIVYGSNQTVCAGASSANGTFTASGSSGPYTYSYTVGGVSYTITGGSPITIPSPTGTAGTTTYTLNGITDAYGNYQVVSATSSVIVLPAPSGSISATGGCDHYKITFTASGGPGPYTYNYTVNGTPMSATGGSSYSVNGPSVYTFTTYTITGVSVTNSAGCTGTLGGSATANVIPNQSYTIWPSTTSACVNGPSPILTFNYSPGGYTSFLYSFYGTASGSGAVSGYSSATLAVPTTTAGTYTYMVGNPGMCVSTSIPVTITIKPLPTATVSGTASVCKNGTSPVITFTGANGTAPYTFTYKINGGSNQTISSGTGTTATINVPTSTTGTFTYSLVSVSSTAGCSQNQTGSAVITVNPLPTATIAGNSTVCQNTASPAITFTGAGASSPYTFSYNINGGATQTISSGSASTITISVPTTSSGTFTYNLLSVSSAAGCSQIQTGSATITVNPTATATISGTAVLCQNDASPTVTFTGVNGTAPYTFSYNINGGTAQTISSGSSSTATINVPTTASGTTAYNLLTVSGANGCLQGQTGTASITIDPTPTATISGTTVVCQNGAEPVVTFTGSNGTAPYTFSYNINGGAIQTISSGSSSTATLNVPTSSSGLFIYNLLSVSGANSCSQNQTGSVTVMINSLTTAGISGTATLCQNDASPVITFTGTGGTAPYIFSYNVNGGTTQTISSGNNSTADISVPTNNAGTFTYNLMNVSNVNGCSQNQVGSAVVTINSIPAATISGTASLCENDPEPIVTFTGMNGSAPYSFSYNINGGTTQTISSGSSSTVTLNIPTSNSGTFTYNLLSVSGAGTCSQNLNGSAIIIIHGVPTATITGNPSVCENNPAEISFEGFGGTSPYIFSYTVNGGPVQTISSGSGTTAQVSVLTTSAANFVYTLDLVSEANGCFQNPAASASIAVNEQPVLPGITPVCEGTSVQLTAGGSSPVVSWTSSDPSVASISSSGLLTTLAPGSSTITCTNSDGCSDSQSIQVLPAPTATISGNTTVCEGNTAVFTISGTPNATVSYSDGTSGFTTVIPASGNIAITSPVLNDTITYTLSNVQSACSQSLTGSITINVTPTPVMAPISDLTICPQDLVQVPAFNAPNGTIFNWTNSNTSIGLSGSGTGNIMDFIALNTQTTVQTGTITVTPSLNGCTGSSVSFGINVSQLPVANAGINQSFCVNDADPHFIGSTPVIGNSYSWSPTTNLSDPTISNPSVITVVSGQSEYVLTVTTASGCQNTDTVLFTGIDAPVISLTASSQFACENGIIDFHLQANEQVTISWFVDGSPLAEYTNETDWSYGFQSGSHSVYVVTTNNSGCSSTAAISGGITVYPGVTADFTTGLNSTHIDEFTDHIDLINESENATVYDWSFNGAWFSSQMNPVMVFEPGNNFITIQLVAKNDFGCSDTAILNIEPITNGVVYVPNSFTPDGNQFNSIFIPVVSDDFDKSNYLFEIYNRWGELIFNTTDPNEGWTGVYKGQMSKTDTYTWKLTLKSTKTDLNQVIVGHLNLLR